MVEYLQFADMIKYRDIYLLILFFLFFVVLPAVWMKLKSRRYKPISSDYTCPVTVIVAVYEEDHDLYNRCLASIWRQNPDQLIVSMDGQDEKLVEISQKYGAEIIRFPERAGKRKAMATAWDSARNDIIVHVDSDIILQPDCLEEISKPFVDQSVVSVATAQYPVKNGSAVSYAFSSLITKNMQISGKALNGHLIIADGKCNALRKDFLLKVKQHFLNDIWLGQRGEIGDDRFLTREALKAGYKVVFQETAGIFVPSPKSVGSFINQQVRWRRSGMKYFIKDLLEGVHPAPLYLAKSITYYLAPFVFITAVVLDSLYFHLTTNYWSYWWVYMILLFPSLIAITTMRQAIYHGRPPLPKYLPLQGVLGLFLILPISLYGAVTCASQGQWLTRGSNGKGNHVGRIFPSTLVIVAMLSSTLALLTPIFLAGCEEYC